jgi:hypothetical protein
MKGEEAMNKRTIFGPVLILLGVYLFLNPGEKLGAGTIFEKFWPVLFVIPLGLFFHWLYFGMTGRKGTGLLIPGGILFAAGVTCQIAILFDGWQYMWPGFIMAVAIGLFEFYWFGSRNKWILLPINILGVISILFFAVFSIGSLFNRLSFYQPIIAVTVILAGSYLLVAKKKGD